MEPALVVSISYLCEVHSKTGNFFGLLFSLWLTRFDRTNPGNLHIKLPESGLMPVMDPISNVGTKFVYLVSQCSGQEGNAPAFRSLPPGGAYVRVIGHR
jgi:hypothetical protein